MINIFVYLIVFVVAFMLGRASLSRPVPLSLYELQELRKERGTSIHARVEKSKNRIMDYVYDNGRVTNDEVEDMLLVSDSTARRYLSELERNGRLIQIGETGSGVYYTLPEERE